MSSWLLSAVQGADSSELVEVSRRKTTKSNPRDYHQTSQSYLR